MYGLSSGTNLVFGVLMAERHIDKKIKADKKQQKLNCNIPFYLKSTEQTITFKLCFISQFECNGLNDP